jgi:hypothetical protein
MQFYSLFLIFYKYAILLRILMVDFLYKLLYNGLIHTKYLVLNTALYEVRS